MGNEQPGSARPGGRLRFAAGPVGSLVDRRTRRDRRRARGGSVAVAGTDVSTYSSARRLRSGLAWVPEGRNVFQYLTVRDNLRMSAMLAGTLSNYSETERMVFDLFPAMAEKINSTAGT